MPTMPEVIAPVADDTPASPSVADFASKLESLWRLGPLAASTLPATKVVIAVLVAGPVQLTEGNPPNQTSINQCSCSVRQSQKH